MSEATVGLPWVQHQNRRRVQVIKACWRPDRHGECNTVPGPGAPTRQTGERVSIAVVHSS